MSKREPIKLIRADDPERKVQLYACAGCGALHSPRIYACKEDLALETARKAAEDCYTCKTHNICSMCGEECSKHYTACDRCRYQKKFKAAQEVTDNGGPYCLFDGDTYYSDMEEAQDDGAEWVSPCNISYPSLDIDNILEGLTSDMHEDADESDLYGVEELTAAVNAFNKAQKTQSWWGDGTRRIRVPAAGAMKGESDD